MLGRATKIAQALMTAPKEYVCLMRLHGRVTEDELVEVLRKFIGPIYQRPPLRSSVKRVVRIRRIYYIELLDREDRNVLIRVGCERGTYIRKLCHDIGELLGCGAHMQELRRTKVGPFEEDETLVTLQDVMDAYRMWIDHNYDECLRSIIMPIEKAVEHLPKLVIRDSAVDAICHGAWLAVPGVLRMDSGIKVGDTVAIMTQKGELVAIAEATMRSEEILTADHGIAAKLVQVLMAPGIYPPAWKKK